MIPVFGTPTEGRRRGNVQARFVVAYRQPHRVISQIPQETHATRAVCRSPSGCRREHRPAYELTLESALTAETQVFQADEQILGSQFGLPQRRLAHRARRASRRDWRDSRDL